MTPERWRQITAVFHQAQARDPAARGAFLDEACMGDPALRAEVTQLLAADREARAFGDTPIKATGNLSFRGPGSAESAMASAIATSIPIPGIPTAPADSTVSRGRRPFLALVWLTAAISLAAFSYGAWLLITERGATSTVGWREAPRAGSWYVESIDPAGPAAAGVQRGDRIIALNGIPPLGPFGFILHRESLSAGDAYDIELDRNGERVRERFTAAAGPNLLTPKLTFFFVSLVWCAVGLFIGVAQPEKTLARLACASAVATGLVFLDVWVLRTGPLWQPLHVVLGFHFFARFPADRPTSGIWRWALVLTYVTAGVTAAIGLWTHGVLTTQGLAAAAQVAERHSAFFGLRPRLAMFYLVAVIGLLLSVPHNYRLLTDEDSRRRVRLVVYSAGVGLLLQLWWAVVYLYELMIGPSPVSKLDVLVNVVTITVPVSIAYAIVKHRMFDIRVVVRRGLQYLLARRAVQMAVAIPLAALVYTIAVNRHRTVAELASETRAYLFWLGAAGLTLRFRRPIQLWIDRRFFREELDREHLLLGLLEDVGRIDSISDLSVLVSEKLESALHPGHAYLWYRDAHERDVASSSGALVTPAGCPSSERWLAWLEERRAVATVPLPDDAPLSRNERLWFSERRINLIVPIVDSSDRLVGALLLGEKKSEEPYSAGDARILIAIAKQAAVVRENVRLRERVGEEVRVRHDVLARLDGRLANLLKECPRCGACFEGPAERCEHDGGLLTLSLPVARTIVDRYRLDRLIGKGGMGAVYEARDLRLERSVAVKIMLGRAFGQQAALRRFHREARAAARVNHPNIVSVHDVGVLEGEGAFLVMELLHGVTMRAELNRQKTMPPGVAAAWFAPLLDGMAAAHAQGIVHRDLKPENVMGHRDTSEALTVKILDLGLAKLREANPRATGTMTAEGMAMGTFGYMSPEQLAGRDVDHRTDIYAAAVMLIEALTANRPFERDGSGLPSSPFQAFAGLPGASPEARALGDLLQRCLARDARDRVASAEALRDELIPLLRECPPLTALV